MENPNKGNPIPILDEWCCGFLKGVDLDAVGWLPVTAGKPEWMSTLMLYGTEAGWEVLKKKNLSLDEHISVSRRLKKVRKLTLTPPLPRWREAG